MSNTITWSINTLERNLPANDVYTLHWTAVLTRDNPDNAEKPFTSSCYGTVGLTADVSDPNFIPYESLTEEICIGWLLETLGTEKVDGIEASLTQILDEQQTPKRETGVPW